MTRECIKTACPYCGVGCGVEVNATGIQGDKHHPANSGALCVKGSALAQSLDMPSRLLYPKLNGREITWQQATDMIANAYHDAIVHHGADSTAMYVSGQLLTEDYYVANKFMKGVVGSANIDTNSRLCMSSAVVAHNRAFGEDVVPVNYDDIDDADLIIICGANTAWTHPVLFRRIQQARECNPELRMVVIDPRETVTAQQADLHLAIPDDGDIALFNGLLRYCQDQGLVDQEYVAQHTSGLAALCEALAGSEYKVSALSNHLKLSQEQLTTFYRWFANTRKTITLFCQGVNQSQYGADKGNVIINAHLATGKIGYGGAGPFSITGQPNAMGGREVGGLANQLAVHRGFDQESIELVGEFWQTDNLATTPGLKAVEMFEAVERGDIQVIWIMATNPVVSMPDNNFVKRALKKCPLVIVSDVTSDSDIAQYADLLLPAAGWGEKQGMVTNSERMLTRQRQFIETKGQAKSDWRAVSEVGAKLCTLIEKPNAFEFATEADVFREYAAMTGINSSSDLLLDLSTFADITDEEYLNWQPVQWGGTRPFANGQFCFPDRKARFVVPAIPTAHNQSAWWLNSGRQRDQWHTMTRTGYIPHLAATEPEPTVYMNQRSAAYLDVNEGQLVSLQGEVTEHCIVAKAAIDNGLGARQLFMSMHWAGEYGGGSEVNAVVSREVDPHSGQPAFKSQRVAIQTVDAKTYGLYLGEKFVERRFAYQSFQSEENIGVWRFADTDNLDRDISEDLGQTPHKRKVVLELASGWLTVGYDEVGQERVTRSILIVSGQPIVTDASQLAILVGKPLSFSTLLAIAAQQESSELICSCFRVNDKQIARELESGNCNNLSQLQSKLKCGTNCGSCLPQIERLISHHQHTILVAK
ncbi:nitrate reductase [Vibrio sinaloensis]|uniref:nitrate reductase n=1 Tax=Photobacterium sp. (strain ATCC 43367) TaxID=379097 RepID=UPI00206F2E2C|nr:molybdopterin-dependent oxidoreductase [Vibrio sinaloensis]UPQ89987.1 molybdopterin-dependent oxidoreductase [Vibrio sinaloensis]